MSAIALGRSAGWRESITRLRGNAKKHLLAAGSALVIAGALAFGTHYMTIGRYIESTDDAYVGGDVTSIAPHVAGFISEIDVSDNERVRKGQLLMRLDDRDYMAALAHAEATVSAKRAALSDLEAKYALQQSTIAQAGATLKEKAAFAAFARDDDARYQRLGRALASSRQDVQRAFATDAEAGSDMAAAQAGLAGANQQLSVLQADIDQAQADVAQAEADRQTARLNRGYTEIRSPIDGYVGNRAVRVGAYVTVGAYLASITPARGLWVDANFKEDQLERMHAGEQATVVADLLPGHTFHGRVASIAPGTGAVFSVIPPENATGNFTKIVQRVPVRILLDSDDPELGFLRPGVSITADIDTRVKSAS